MIFDSEGRVTKEGFTKLKELVNDPLNPVIFLSFDPGKGTGVTGYDAKYYMQFMWTLHEADVVKFLACFEKVSLVVMESYRVFAHKAKEHIGSDLLTSRVIGRIEHWVETIGATLVTQQSSIKDTGYKWAKKKPLPKSNPLNHALDAHIHFIYFAVRRGFINLNSIHKKPVSDS